MEQKSPKKLSHMQGHQALLVFMDRVAPAEGHLIIFKGSEPVIGDRNSMRVTAEIAEGMLGAAKGPFAIDHPLLTKRLLYQLRKDLWPTQRFQTTMKAELALSKDLLQRLSELTSEHLSQHIDGKEELCV